MNVNEQIKIYSYHYPFAEKVNPILHKTIEGISVVEDENVPGALQSPFKCEKLFASKEFKLIVEYVRSLILDIPDYRPIFTSTYRPKLELINWWGMFYNEGCHQPSHQHSPAHWSFVYYVNTPKGSSPLLFDYSKKKVFPKAGDVVLFPAFLFHSVVPNKCKNRSVVVGNFYWKI